LTLSIVLDATAAYQNFNRKEALRQILHKIPGMFKLFNAMYRESTSVWFNMDDNITQEFLSQLGSRQGGTAATLIHAFGALRPLQLVQEHMTSPGEFIAAYSDNVNGRGSHDHCIDGIKTTQRIGPDYGIKLGTIKVLLGATIDNDEQSKRREAYISLGVNPSHILSHSDDDEIPTPSRYAKYGVKTLGIPLGSQEFMEKFVKDKFEGLRDEWSIVLCYHDPQSAWLVFSICLSCSINHMCSQILPSIILKYAHIFDDNMRRAVRRVFKVQLSDTEWRRLKLPCSQGGCDIFDINNVANAGYFFASSLSSTNSVTATTTLMTAFLAPSVSSTSIAHNLQEWPTNSACFNSPRKPRENA
jgi:hypothetical protein